MQPSRSGCARPSGAAARCSEDVLIYAVFCALIAAEPSPPLLWGPEEPPQKHLSFDLSSMLLRRYPWNRYCQRDCARTGYTRLHVHQTAP